MVPRHSWLESAGGAGGLALRHSWLRSAGMWGVVVAGGPSPLLAEGPGWAFPHHSWLRAPGAVPCHSCLGGSLVVVVGGPSPPSPGSWMRFPATPGWDPPAAAVAVSVGLGCGFSVLCVFVARRVRVASVLVCVLCVRGVCVGCGAGVGVSSACVCVCVCVRVWCVGGLWFLVLAPPGWGLLLVLVWVWLVCAVVGPSPLVAEVSECDSPPLPAGFRCWWWLVFLATPD